MAPLKVSSIANRPKATISSRSTIHTRSKAAFNTNENQNIMRTKRKADCSPSKDTTVNAKRSALVDLPRQLNQIPIRKDINVKGKLTLKPPLKVTVKSKQLPQLSTVLKPKNNENVMPPNAPEVKPKTRLSIKDKEPLKETNKKVKTRLSNEFEKTEESLYTTAVEDLSIVSTYDSAKGPQTRSRKENVTGKGNSRVSIVTKQFEKQLKLDEVPEGVIDFDQENMGDVNQSSEYAMDIFKYLKQNELLQKVPDYMTKQIHLNSWMRSLLVDWMVEIQESFELNHETLYLGVKLVDMYLSKIQIGKETLQLVGAAAMFVACKYDERIPPLIDDFLYICDGAYNRKDLIKMELHLLKVCDFNMGVSISYRFLRRYGRCAKVSMPILTLARYILEMSLMNYEAVTIRESELAAASLYMALKMKNISGWTKTLEYYSDYKIEDFIDTVYLLNKDIHKKPKPQLMTIRNKYSHQIFFEVAKTPLLEDKDLKP